MTNIPRRGLRQLRQTSQGQTPRSHRLMVAASFELRLLSFAQLKGIEVVRVGDLQRRLKLTARQETTLLYRMSRSGVIVRAQRGVYLLPRMLPVGARWQPDASLVLQALIVDNGGAYQITGPGAFNRYGFDEQVPNRLYVYNNRISGRRVVGGLSYEFIEVATSRLGGIAKYGIDLDKRRRRNPEKVGGLVFGTIARTLVDAVYEWSRFGTLPRAYEWIRSVVEQGRVEPTDLVAQSIRFGNQATIRRMGWQLAASGVSSRVLGPLARKVTSTRSLIPTVPGRPLRGERDRIWGVIVNA
jgi:predicted transcriptional regulator of viral defense system